MAWAIEPNRSALAGFPFAEGVIHFYVRQKISGRLQRYSR